MKLLLLKFSLKFVWPSLGLSLVVIMVLSKGNVISSTPANCLVMKQWLCPSGCPYTSGTVAGATHLFSTYFTQPNLGYHLLEGKFSTHRHPSLEAEDSFKTACISAGVSYMTHAEVLLDSPVCLNYSLSAWIPLSMELLRMPPNLPPCMALHWHLLSYWAWSNTNTITWTELQEFDLCQVDLHCQFILLQMIQMIMHDMQMLNQFKGMIHHMSCQTRSPKR